MFTETTVKRAIQREAEQITSPRQLDAQILTLFERHHQTRPLPKPKRLYRASVIAACCMMLFTGVAYASSVLYILHTDSVQLEVTKDSAVNLPQATVKEISESLYDVQSQLAPGENAYAYVPELAQRNLPAVIRVANPTLFPDLTAWKEAITPYAAAVKLPTDIPQDFNLEGGRLQQAMEGTDPDKLNTYETTLKQTSQQTGGKLSWVKAETVQAPQLGINTPNLLYTNKRNGQIQLSFQVIPDANTAVSVKTGDFATAEKVSVHGKEAYISKQDNNFLTKTGYYLELSWIEAANGQSIVYQISTDDAAVTKDELLRMAASMK